MNMKLQAWTRGLLFSSFILTAANGYAVIPIGGINFADNAFADRVLSTDFTGHIVGRCGATPTTIDDAVTGPSFDTLADYGVHEMFAGADGDYNVPVGSTPPNRYLEFGFTDNVIVNLEGDDLVFFEQGSPANAFRVARDKFSIQNPYSPGAFSVVAIPGNNVDAGFCVEPRMAFVDLSDLGFTNGERVYRIFVSSALLENGDVAWNNPVNPSWGVPEILAVAALNSEDKANYPPEVDIIQDEVTVSLLHALTLKSTDAIVEDDRSWHVIDVIDDSTQNASLTYLWTQTVGIPATISSSNTLATNITFAAPGDYTFRLTVTDASTASAYDDLTVHVTSADSTAPSTPASFAAEVLSNTGVSLTWSASTDNVAVKHYNIYRDNVLLTRTSNLFYKDFRVEPGEDYSYLIRAVDTAGNLSGATNLADVTLSARLFARRVAASADDAEEHADGVVVIGDGDLELVEDGAFGAQTVGLRFQNVTVPADATIVKAWLDFMADETSADVTSLEIHGIAEDNPVPFAATNFNISTRPVTSASAVWSDVPGWSVLRETYRAVDMADVVQELINAPGWASGEAMAFTITGTGRRVAEPYEGGARLGPRLFIEYQDPEPVNQPPVVSAGADQEIVLPTNSVSLEGSVTDDNLTGELTLSWTKQSGLGTVTFSAPDATATEATFSLAGDYVLRLTANDGELTHYDEVAVTVAPQPNLAPLVNVGEDRSVSIAEPFGLAAVVTDDGISGEPVVYLWDKVSGPEPGTVEFDPIDAVETSVTFSHVGTYVLRLTANDGDDEIDPGSDYLTVVVSAPDNEAPSQPQNLTLDEIAIGSVEVTWTASTDNVGVVAYLLYRNDVEIAEVAGTEYIDTGLDSGTTYTYKVIALDVENESEPSVEQSITTETVPNDAPEQTISLIRSDGAEQAQNGAMSIGSWPIDLGSLNTAVGLRFNNIEAPSRALISRAYLRFCARYAGSAPTSLNIAALNEADAEAFVAENGHLTGRATIGNVEWNIDGAWSENECYNSADIRSLVQSIVAKGEWRAGNSIGFIITGSGDRKAYYGGTTNALTNAPQLFLEYFGGNQAPVVSAGTATSVRLPDTLELSGSATDVDNDQLSYQWTSVSVPRGGGVEFVDANAAATEVSFTVAGNYTLRLTASDGEKSGSADVVVTVLRANQAPIVNVGDDRTVTLPNTLPFNASVTDDGVISTPSVEWTKMSGPGDIGIVSGSQNSRTVRFSFSEPGVYVLRLTAFDGELPAFDEVTVTVNAATGGGDGGGSGGTDSGGGGGGGSLDLWSLLALILVGGIRFGSARTWRRRLSGGCTH